MTVLVQFEHVVTAADIPRPIQAGKHLLLVLLETQRVVLLTAGRRSAAERFLLTEGLRGVADIVDSSVALPDVPLYERQIELVLSRGPVDFLLAGDPALVSWAVGRGLTTLLFSSPVSSTLRLRPERGNQSWDELVAVLDARAIAKSNATITEEV